MPRLGHNTGVLPVEMDHHTVAAIAISGSCLDVLGSLYTQELTRLDHSS